MRALAGRLPEACGAGESIILFGTPGTGKDHLIASLLHIATGRYGVSADWLSGYALINRFRNTMGRGADESEACILSEIKRRHVLAISDPIPPGADPSGWELNKLFAVIDARYQNMLPTWITMNAASEQEAADKLTQQVWDRLIDRGHKLPCFWPSYRADRKP